jgi:hypothetical protein
MRVEPADRNVAGSAAAKAALSAAPVAVLTQIDRK